MDEIMIHFKIIAVTVVTWIGISVPGAVLADPPASATTTSSSASRVLWDGWYTVLVGNKVKYAYYNEKAEIKGDRVHFQTRMWKQEEGFINEENMGAFALNDARLTPLFFNFRSTYRSTETKIDGTVGKDQHLSVRVQRGGQSMPPIRRRILDNPFFSVFFPVWIGKNLNSLPQGKTVSFSAILEDNLDTSFRSVPGNIRLDAPDEFAKKTGTKKFIVNHRDLTSVWWVKDSGMPVRIQMPSQKTLIQMVPQAEAEKFL